MCAAMYRRSRSSRRGSDFLQDAHILAQILQVLGSFLKEHLDGFAVRECSRASLRHSSDFCNSSAVGLRYKMQSFNTMAWNFTGILEMDSEWPRKR